MASMARDQVFINFRGRDCRCSFVSFLKAELKRNDINVFTDEEAARGEPLENLFQHIKNSRIALVIFSNNYAESEWCLDELVEIKKWVQAEKLAAIPVFYKVKTAHVKKQSGKFGQRFHELQNHLLGHPDHQDKKRKKRANSRIKRWKKALKYVVGNMGMTYEKRSSEMDFVTKIVEEVKRALGKVSSEEEQMIQRRMPSQSGQANHVERDIDHLNEVFPFSIPSMEPLNLERPNLEVRRLVTLLRSVQHKHRSMFLPREVNMGNRLPFSESLEAHSPPDWLEKASNWLALAILSESTHPALVFTNWNELDRAAKNDIVNYALRKRQQMADELRLYNGDVGFLMPVSRPRSPVRADLIQPWTIIEDFSSNSRLPHHSFPRHAHAPSFDLFDNRQPQYWYDYGRNNASFPNEYSPLPPGIVSDGTPKDDGKKRDDIACFQPLVHWFKLCFCVEDDHPPVRRTKHHQPTHPRC